MGQFADTKMPTVKDKATFNQKCPSYFDSTYNHNHILVAALLPMAQTYACKHMKGVSHILRLTAMPFSLAGI